jgi:hypothetical protein
MCCDVIRPRYLALVVQWMVFAASSTHFIFCFYLRITSWIIDLGHPSWLSITALGVIRLLSMPKPYLFIMI